MEFISSPIDDKSTTTATTTSATASSIETPRGYIAAYAHGEMNPKKRHTMEDCHRVLPVLSPDLPQYSYFGVYDGHGGRQIVDFLEEALENNIVIELKLPDEASVEERLGRAFGITDMQSRKMDIVASGATAVSVLLETSTDGQQRTVYSANVGDSRAVLVTTKPAADTTVASSSGFYARRLTYDHRAEDESEQMRIQQAGGFIARGRVLGILAVTRSFGDHGMKDFVVAEPYTTTTKLGMYFYFLFYHLRLCFCMFTCPSLTDLTHSNLSNSCMSQTKRRMVHVPC